VLGTPPAFVLSQDQTLREELLVLLTKSRQEYKPNIRPQRKATVGVGSTFLGPPLVGRDPRIHTDRGPDGLRLRRRKAGERESEYTVGSGMQDGVNLGTVVRVPPRGALAFDGVEPLDTLSDRESGRRVRMLLSFQRPSHLLRKVVLLKVAPETLKRIPGRTDEYSARNPLST